MNTQIVNELKNKNAKLFIVDKELQQLIEELRDSMNTNAHDVVHTATKLLKKCMGKRVILQDLNSDTDVEIRAFEDVPANKSKI